MMFRLYFLNEKVKASIMDGKYWFAGRLNDEATTVYLFASLNISYASALMRTMAKNPVIEQLTWSRLSKITGCVIPTEADKHHLATGHIIMHRKHKTDLVLLPV